MSAARYVVWFLFQRPLSLNEAMVGLGIACVAVGLFAIFLQRKS